jgi:hypothetical protein
MKIIERVSEDLYEGRMELDLITNEKNKLKKK